MLKLFSCTLRTEVARLVAAFAAASSSGLIGCRCTGAYRFSLVLGKVFYIHISYTAMKLSVLGNHRADYEMHGVDVKCDCLHMGVIVFAVTYELVEFSC